MIQALHEQERHGAWAQLSVELKTETESLNAAARKRCCHCFCSFVSEEVHM
jgi:hypothetical protein